MGIKSIVVCIGTPSNSLIPVKYAISLAKIMQVKLYALHVINEKVLGELLKSRVFVEVEARIYQKELEEQGALFLQRVQKMAESKSVECETISLRGEISTELIKKTKELEANLLVMGGLKEVFSVSEVFYDEGERIFRRSPCPVVVVRNPEYVEQLYKGL